MTKSEMMPSNTSSLYSSCGVKVIGQCAKYFKCYMRWMYPYSIHRCSQTMSDTYQKIWCSRYMVADCNLEVFIIIKTLKWSFWTLEINIEILRIIYIYIELSLILSNNCTFYDNYSFTNMKSRDNIISMNWNFCSPTSFCFSIFSFIEGHEKNYL